jgi:hypothetical protein
MLRQPLVALLLRLDTAIVNAKTSDQRIDETNRPSSKPPATNADFVKTVQMSGIDDRNHSLMPPKHMLCLIRFPWHSRCLSRDIAIEKVERDAASVVTTCLKTVETDLLFGLAELTAGRRSCRPDLFACRYWRRGLM